jgi:alpha-L-rhamnosidase
MNSFNHYGQGSIGDWLYDAVGGLAPGELGYRKLVVSGEQLSSSSSSVRTSYGQATTTWSRDAAGRLAIDVDVPVNTRAEVHIPVADGRQALESGKPAAEQPGVTYKGATDGDAVYEVGSGSYRFLAATVDGWSRRHLSGALVTTPS